MKFDLLGFAEHLAKLPLAVMEEQHHQLEHAAKTIEREAKAEIGTYQPAVGPFAAWAPLAEGTIADKAQHGYAPPDNPLLREGELRESISHEVGEHEAVVGSTSMVAVWQEMGTARIPPRSFLGSAAAKHGEVRWNGGRPSSP